jgi:hypothetical protein
MASNDLNNLKILFPFFYENVEFECGNGWFQILYNLAKNITLISHKERIHYKCKEAKEKDGTLYFVVIDPSEEIMDLIKEAQMQSFITCEICGVFGELKNHNLIYMVRCRKCIKDEHRF